jgi:aryl-alcohol dehydrogenase-like predicted oxidoreductase
MQTTQLGSTGLVVSRVGFGGIPIQRLTEAQAIRVVQRALDLGITLLDTANNYTTSEERIGKAIADRRHGLVIATKTTGRDRETARQHLELSLQRLGTDVIDLWQLHNVSSFESYDAVLGPRMPSKPARSGTSASAATRWTWPGEQSRLGYSTRSSSPSTSSPTKLPMNYCP